MSLKSILRKKALLGGVGFLVLACAALLWHQIDVERGIDARRLQTRTAVIAAVVAAAVRAPLLRGDRGAVAGVIEPLLRDDWVAYIRVYGKDGLVAHVGGNAVTSGGVGMVSASEPVSAGGRVVGRVVVGRTLGDAWHGALQENRYLLAMALSFLGLGILLSFGLAGLLFRDMRRLREGARRIATGEYGYQLPVSGDDELEQAVAAFNAMSRSLEQARRLSDERERALRLSEMRLAEAQRIASLGNWEWNYASGEFYWSEQACRVFGLAPSEAPATYEAFIDLIHADDRERVRKALGDAIDHFNTFDVAHRTASDGDGERWVRERGSLFRAADGAPLRMVGTVQDITDTRRAEAELLDKTQRIVALLENTTDAYFAVDREWRIAYFNAEAERTLGVARERALNEIIWDIAPELASNFFKRFRNALMQQRREAFEAFYPPLQKWFETHLYPYENGLWVFFRDVTERRKTEAALRESSARRQMVLDNILDGIVTIDANGIINGFNRAAERIFGYPAGEVLGRPVSMLMPRPYRDQHEASIRRYLMNRDTGQSLGRTREMTAMRKNGETFPLEISLSEGTQRDQPLFIAVLRDLTEARRVEENTLLAAKVFDNSVEGILVTDAQGRIMRVNRAFSAITGYAEEDILGKTPAVLKSGRHDELFYQHMWLRLREEGRWQGEIWNRRKSGEIYPEWLSINMLRDAAGETTHFVAIFSDISEKKEAEQRIYHLAYYDTLTELPNRTMFYGRLQQAMIDAKRNHRLIALLYIDLDRFKNINDTLGHFIGDELLKHAAQRLAASIRECDTVARLGGDEFVIMLTDLHDEAEVVHIAQKVLGMMEQSFRLEGHEVFVTTSIGIGIYPGDAENLEDLVKYADTAMYHAKEKGRNNYQFYRAEMNSSAFERLLMENSLRRALEREEFTLHFQPQNELAGGSIIGFETLLRWHHPELGVVMPTEFVPVLEEAGLIAQVGAWVLRGACRQIVAWRTAGYGPLRVAVNLSPYQFAQPGLLEMVQEVLRETGADPSWLEFEITEGSLMDDAEASIVTMRRLKELGIRLSIDDFGTGYSSLSYLRRFPVDTLKIDQSFVRDVDGGDAAIAGAIIAMGHSLNLRVLAEGVESREQLDFLRRHGCDEMQGFLFGSPMAADEAERLLRERRTLDSCAEAMA